MENDDVRTKWEQAEAPASVEPDWSEAFTPFSGEEVELLRLYVEQVEGMHASPFLKQPSMSVTLKGRVAPARMETEMEYVGEDLLRAFLTYFRPPYLTDAPSGFKRTLGMLRRHAREKRTPESEEVRAVLDNYGKAEGEARRHTGPIAMHGDTPDGKSVEITGERIVNVFTYGRYFKRDPDKAALLRKVQHNKMYQFAFMSTVQDLANVYTHLATVASRVLDEPKLLPG